MTVVVKDYFDVKYGNSLSLSNLKQSKQGYNFISRTSKNNGVSSKVKLIENEKFNPPNTITVAVGGSVMESFLQKKPFYTGYHILVLHPKIKLSEVQLLYYCMCLKANKYRYNFGRQANKTLKYIQIPSIKELPSWVNKSKINKKLVSEPILKNKKKLDNINWGYFEFHELFDIEKGREISSRTKTGNIPLISATREKNGIKKFIKSGKKLFSAGTITVPSNGASTGEAFYQNKDYYATGDVNILKSKFDLNKYVALFITTIIRLEKYRFNYGRKWGKDRMEDSKIKLPIGKNMKPDWNFMEQYIKSLSFSSNL